MKKKSNENIIFCQGIYDLKDIISEIQKTMNIP